MTTEQQNLAWKCLPKEVRDTIKERYRGWNSVIGFETECILYDELFGYHNLTSDEEPPELLFVERENVIGYYKDVQQAIGEENGDTKIEMEGREYAMIYLFGDKCLPDKEPSVQVEPRFNVGQQVKIILCTHPEYRNKIGIITSIDSCGNLYVKVDGLGTLFHAPYALEPYTEPKFKVGDKVRVKGDTKVREVYRVLPDGKVMFGDKGSTHLAINLELVEPETKDNMEEKELKEKYWKTGNIFEMSTGEKRLVWENQLIDAGGFIPKGHFNENLVNTDSTIGEKVIRVYSSNKKAGYFNELTKTKEENLLWEKSDFIFTEKEIKEKLGIPQDKELIIVK